MSKKIKPLSYRSPFVALALAFVLAAIPPAGAAAQYTAASLQGREVIPGGTAFGVKVYASGVMVVGISDIETDVGLKSPAYEAGIRVKDIITEVSGSAVSTVEHLSELLTGSSGQAVALTVQRGNNQFETTLHPVMESETEGYKVGMWVRDSTAGIGMMTYYDPTTGLFGGLGHAISDVDTGEIVPIDYGTVVGAEIIDVRPGQKGTAGELVGVFDDSLMIGELFHNGKTGVFGIADSRYSPSEQTVPIALKSEIREGPAEVITSVTGIRTSYDIEITKVMQGAVDGKSMCITVTDPELIAITNGIVQGMSGSPIIQNGKLVGAITHVTLQDPTKGYAIFIETMIETAENAITE